MIEILQAMVLIVSVCLAILATLGVIISQVIDAIKLRRQNKKIPTGIKPTILVYAEDARSLETFFESSDYLHADHDIVVVDETEREESRLIKAVSRKPGVYHYRPRKKHAYSALLSASFARSKKSETVLWINSGVVLSTHDMNRCLDNYQANGATAMMHIPYVYDSTSFSGVTQVALSAVDRLWNKVGYAGHERTPVASNTYLMGSSAAKGKSSKIITADNAIANAYPRRAAYRSMKTIFIIIIFTLSVGSIMLALLLTALQTNHVEPFIGSWALVSIGLTIVVLFDSAETFVNKINVTLCWAFIPLLMVISLLLINTKRLLLYNA